MYWPFQAKNRYDVRLALACDLYLVLERACFWHQSDQLYLFWQTKHDVARAQHLGPNGRFAQQLPRGWLRAAQHAIFGAQHFSPQAERLLRVFFSGKKNWGPFIYFAGGVLKKSLFM